MSVKYQILAAGEVLGRQIVDRMPALRQRIARMVRKPLKNVAAVDLLEFTAVLVSLGVKEGDSLMVHSAWDGMRQLNAKPSEVIGILHQLLGDRGTLIMPTGPLTQKRNGIQVYNIQKSPTSLGLLSESFRRMPGVCRSPFPVGTVCASGRLASEYTKDFYIDSGGTAYGHGSPYWQLRENSGKVLVLGIDFIRVLSLSHSAFDIIGDDNPILDYYVETPYIVIDNDKEVEIIVRTPNLKLTSYLATNAFEKMIINLGACKTTELGRIKIALIDARSFLDWHIQVARQYGWPFWGFRNKKKK